jgi:hypothetical protein
MTDKIGCSEYNHSHDLCVKSHGFVQNSTALPHESEKNWLIWATHRCSLFATDLFIDGYLSFSNKK